VLRARGGGSTSARAALATLCQTYWYPLYAFVRRQGHPPHDAQDLTQEFFARLLARNYLADVAREKGRFRSFLLVALKHFLANEGDRARAAKRGGGQSVISLDDVGAEGRYQLEPVDRLSADRIFDRRWALTLLERVLERLRAEYGALEKTGEFEAMQDCLTGKSDQSYAVIARKLGTSEGAVKVAVHRLRKRYRELLRAEVAETVDGPAEVEEELRELLRALAE
jgi:RNA polymerase sigma-70 factor (ECF subfamily)